MPNPICVHCEVELRPHKNGTWVKELKCSNKVFYKLWRADVWKCPLCGVEIVIGFGKNPMVEDWQLTSGALLDAASKKILEDAEQEGVILCKELNGMDKTEKFIKGYYIKGYYKERKRK